MYANNLLTHLSNFLSIQPSWYIWCLTSNFRITQHIDISNIFPIWFNIQWPVKCHRIRNLNFYLLILTFFSARFGNFFLWFCNIRWIFFFRCLLDVYSNGYRVWVCPTIIINEDDGHRIFKRENCFLLIDQQNLVNLHTKLAGWKC